MQTSIRTLKHPDSGIALMLISMHHLGEASYFQAVEEALQNADLVLVEGWEGEPAPSSDFEWIERLFKVSARLLDLQVQPRYGQVLKSKARNLDLPLAKVLALMHAEGIEYVDSQWKALITRWEQLEVGPRKNVEVEEARAILRRNWFRGVRDFMQPEIGDCGSVLDSARESAIFDGLAERLRNVNSPATLALVYGAGHMWTLEPRIVRDLGFVLASSRWLDVMSCDESVLGPQNR
jgi:hypothetical protein